MAKNEGYKNRKLTFPVLKTLVLAHMMQQKGVKKNHKKKALPL